MSELGQLFEEKLFERALIAPRVTGADTLRILSGYASAAMASDHILYLRDEKNLSIDVRLIYGMAGSDGVTHSNHVGFLSLQNKREFAFDGAFSCAYVKRPLAVHSKLYVWSRNETPILAFAGSANYTVNGFHGGTNRREVLAECDPKVALQTWEHLFPNTVPCHLANLAADFAPNRHRPIEKVSLTSTILMETDPKSPFHGCPKVELPLLTKKGDLGDGACLNWGVRSTGKPRNDGSSAAREPNQAYIRLEAKVYRTSFFPPVAQRFTVLTDDGQIFSCARAQQNGKAIHTPQDNSELGRYFRMRLGVPLGAYITPDDLRRYGRTTVTFYKLDDENYVMDFAPPSHAKKRA